MGEPAIVQRDAITGQCAGHQVPNPNSGAPQPGPPMPFSAPLTDGLCDSVRISGRAAAVLGSSGKNTPPHVGLHMTDPFVSPTTQVGRITGGSATVFFEGKPAAKGTTPPSICIGVGQVRGSAATVLIG